jgi:hypothetical protein
MNIVKPIIGTALAIGVGLSLAACEPYQLSRPEQNTAEIGARQYAERLGYQFIGCSGQDSDGDSYVTCSLSNKSNNPVPLLCSYANSSAGCKLK